MKSTDSLNLTGYSDSDWAADPSTRKSVGAYIFMLAGGPLSWACKRNQNICLSLTKVEYKALTSAAKEALWDRQCLCDVGQKQISATKIMCDNMGAIALANNSVFHSRTKHIAIYHHFIREVVAQGDVTLECINTAQNLADALTKPVTAECMERHCVGIGLRKESKLGSTQRHCKPRIKVSRGANGSSGIMQEHQENSLKCLGSSSLVATSCMRLPVREQT